MFNNPVFNLELILPKHQLPRLTALVVAQAGHTALLFCDLRFICYGGKWSFKLIMSVRTKVSCPLKMTGFSFLKIVHHFKCNFFGTDAASPALWTFCCPLPAERRPPPTPFPELSKLPLRITYTFIHIPNYCLFVVSLQRHVFPQPGGKGNWRYKRKKD